MIASLEPGPTATAAIGNARTCSPNIWAGGALEPNTFNRIRRQAVLEGCKWDPQVGDVSTLAPFPLLLDRATWNELASLAEELAAETLRAESELGARLDLLRRLGLPGRIRRALRSDSELTPAAIRVMRFDFHPTTDGWRISEVNSDVPGGFTEASFFTQLMAEHFPDARPTGNPANVWVEAVVQGAKPLTVGLLTAPGYMEDHQIMAYLGKRLVGCHAYLANPAQLRWRDGYAHLETDWFTGKLDAIIRFYQGEWLPHLPRCSGWQHFFRGGRTPVGNPGQAMLSESKRFPLIWNELATPLPTWRRLLPETRQLREAPWRSDTGWLLKRAFSNTGDEVCIPALMNPRDLRGLRRAVWFNPSQWIAQRRFESIPIQTPLGPRHTCLGIYTINGQAAGVYGRLAMGSIVDYSAVDVAVLLQDDP